MFRDGSPGDCKRLLSIDENPNKPVATDAELLRDSPDATSPSKHLNVIYLCVVISSLVLLLNIILLAIAADRAGSHAGRALNTEPAPYTLSGSTGFFSPTRIIYQGSCTLTKRWDTGLHLLVNVLSTAILAASNYCMQSLVAPTRRDIDRAHAQGKWLDIGVPSMRNLLHINRLALVIWVVLMITTTPFHLLYNSAVFSSIGTNEYAVIIAPSSTGIQYVTDALQDIAAVNTFNQPTLVSLNDSSLNGSISSNEFSWTGFINSFSNGTFRNLTAQECIDTFTEAALLPGIGTVIAFSNDLTYDNNQHGMSLGANGSILFTQPGQNPDYSLQGSYPWFCDTTPCSKASIANKTGSPQIVGYANELFTWKLDLVSFGGGLISFYVGGTIGDPWGNFSLDICKQMRVSDAKCNGAQQLLSWIYDMNPSSVQQLDDYIRNNTLAAAITNVGSLGGYYCTPLQPCLPLNQTYSLDGCLVQTIEEKCQLLYNPPISIVIIICAAIKVVCMLSAARLLDREDTPLLTVGDAIASFLTRPDSTTAGMCWMGRSDVTAWSRRAIATSNSQRSDASHNDASITHPTFSDSFITAKRWACRWRLGQVVSWPRWGVVFFL